jgi:hypothetical protein
MWRPLTLVGALAGVVCAVGFSVPDGAVATHGGKNCGIVAKGPHDYRVRAQQMLCKQARRGVSKYLRSHEPRPGFDCAETQGRTPFYCKSGAKAYWAVRL